MRAVSPKRSGDSYKRAKAEKALGREANGWGWCARCGYYTHVNGHERVLRSAGGDPTNPDCLLCVACNDWCTNGSPVWAAFNGWAISGKHSRDIDLAANEARRLDGSIHVFPGGAQ